MDTCAKLYFSVPEWASDPLIEDVTRFAAARPCIGIGALMRRFKVGPIRARYLFEVLDERWVLLGYLRGDRVARVNPYAWSALYGFMADRDFEKPTRRVCGSWPDKKRLLKSLQK
jgi:hypothetical protein